MPQCAARLCSAQAQQLSSRACLQVRDAGNLLTRAGLSLPAVDVDSFQMRYPSAADLVEHLRVGGGG